MSAANKALELASKYVGVDGIESVVVTSSTRTHIAINSMCAISPYLQSEIRLAAEPYRVRFYTKPPGRKVINKSF